jgi:hypothetical protein
MESVSYASPASPRNGNRQYRPSEQIHNPSDPHIPTHLQEHSADDSVSTMSTTLTLTEAAPSPTISFEHKASPKPFGIHKRFPSFSKSYTEATIPSTATTTPNQRPTPPLKKSSSIFGFLKTKEPSTQAFKEYQEAIRKQAGNGRLTVVGMPMVSSAKLPAKVPKVNSKWDGVPEVLKENKGARGRENTSFRSRSSSRSAGRAASAMSNHSKQNSLNSVDARSIASSSNQSSRPDTVWTPSDTCTRDFASMPQIEKSSAPQSPLSDVASFTSSLSDTSKPQEARNNPKLDLPAVPPVPTISTIHTPPQESPRAYNSHKTPQPTQWAQAGQMLTPESNTGTTNSDIQSTTLTIRSRQAIVRSSGYGVLDPPMSAQRKLNQDTTGSDHRPSALKQAQPGSLRPALSSYQMSGLSQGSSSTYLKNRAVAPWDSPITPTFHDRGEGGTTTPSTLQGNKGLFRKAKSSLFRS